MLKGLKGLVICWTIIGLIGFAASYNTVLTMTVLFIVVLSFFFFTLFYEE